MKTQAKIAKWPGSGKAKPGSARDQSQATSAPKIGNARVGTGPTAVPAAATLPSEPRLPSIPIPKGFNVKENLVIALSLRLLPFAEKYGTFAFLVWPGHAWDYKQTFKKEGFLGEAFANRSRLNDVPAEYRNVIKPGDEIQNPYEDFGNWHYGFMGSAAGIPSEILLRAAGAAQKYLTPKTHRPNWSHPLGKPPFGDDPRDQEMINKGIKDFNELHWFDGPSEQRVSPSLEVGRIDDPAEREADAVADRIMRMPDGGACCPACAVGGACASHMPQIEQRQAMPIRRKVAGVGNSAGLPVPAGLEPQVHRATSGGEALPATVRAFFEPRFGEDLSHVRIHRDADAAESARALGAKAYTLGSHIAFSAGRWAPGTDAGDRLIAHELAHATADGREPIRRKVEPDDGTCLRGVMTPMAAGQAAHEKIQTAAKAFEIDSEVGIPRKASRGVPRADLFGVWTESEARRRGLPTTRTPENDTPWVIAEIGEIKPISYAQGGIQHEQAKKEIKEYLKYWKDFSKVPAIPMRSLRSIGPLEFMGSELSCDLDFPLDGLYIYQCSKSRDPKETTVPVGVPIRVPESVKRELRAFEDIEKLLAMESAKVRERLVSAAPALLSLVQELLIMVGVVAATAAVFVLIASAIPAAATAALAAVLIAAASVNASPKGA